MARYIDADKLIDKLENDKYAEPSTDFQRGINAYIDWLVLDIKYAETADVVPKSEVDKLSHKCDECAGCTQWKCDCANIELEVAREIFEEIEKVLDNSVETEHFKGTWFNLHKCMLRIAELKKKYTEGK